MPQKQDKNILSLSYAHPDRHTAARFLNVMMASYHDYLKKENDELASAQLAYLDKRQAELTSSLDRVLDEQSNYMKENLGRDGFVGLKEEVEMLAIPKQAYTSKLFDLEVEEKRLEKEREELPFVLSTLEEREKDDKSKKSAPALLESDQQRYQEQLLQISLKETEMKAAAPGQSELTHVIEEIKETELFIDRLEKRLELPTNSILLKDAKNLVRIRVDEIQKLKRDPAHKGADVIAKEKELVSYLLLHKQLLTDKKRALEENLSLRTSFNKELQGINLATAQNLYVSYQNQLDGIQSTIRQLLYLRDQILAPDFEMSSLGALLKDAVGQGLVQKAADIALQLRDQKNRSIKEIFRLKEALETEKTFLIHHIDQTIELEKLRTKLVEERIVSLQRICLDLIKKEKTLIEDKLGEISVKMEDLPEKWKLENHLRFKKELGMGVIDGISKIVETKNLHYNLFYVDSKPIDLAFAPKKLQPPKLFIFIFGGALLGAAASFMFYLVRGIARGFAVSAEALMHYGLNFCGKLSRFSDAAFKELGDGDLETLRRLASFISQQKRSSQPICVTILGGDSPNYAANLAELLALEQKRSLLIQCTFDKKVRPEEIPGLWHFLEGKIATVPLQRKRDFDFLPTGGNSRHAPELLARATFQRLLENLKPKYQFTLIYSTAKPSLSEAHVFLKYTDLLIVTASEEKIEELAPYKKWGAEKGPQALAFVLGEK